MNISLMKELMILLEKFELSHGNTENIDAFKEWIYEELNSKYHTNTKVQWEGKENGRSPESYIATLLVHMSKYAKFYSRYIIHNSPFSCQEEYIYLINLNAVPFLTKSELIRKNIQEKPAGIQIINRLIAKGWILQEDDFSDKRKKKLSITENGKMILNEYMPKIKSATNIITGNLSRAEKNQLIHLLDKLNHFHHKIYEENAEMENNLATIESKFVKITD